MNYIFESTFPRLRNQIEMYAKLILLVTEFNPKNYIPSLLYNVTKIYIIYNIYITHTYAYIFKFLALED